MSESRPAVLRPHVLVLHEAPKFLAALGELLARSGWAGADAAFEEPAPSAVETAPTSSSVLAAPTAAVASGPPPAHWSDWLASFSRVREAIAEAEATRATSRELLARTVALGQTWSRVSVGLLSPGSESPPYHRR